MFFEDIIFNVKNQINKVNLFDAKDGFRCGNMFRNEYVPYKNYKVKELRADNEENELLIRLSEMEFALNDLSLYLDLHPNDKDLYDRFKIYVNEYKNYLEEYEKNFRPLNLCSTYSNMYDYYKNPWPWDNDGGIKYV